MKDLVINNILPLTQTVGSLAALYLCTRVAISDVSKEKLDTSTKVGVWGAALLFTSFAAQGVLTIAGR